MRHTRQLLPGVMVVLLLAGCSLLRPQADPTRFYILTGPPAVTEPPARSELRGLRIGLQPVEIPAYLRGKSMVVRSGTNEIHFAEFDRWAEPLEQGITQVIKETLRSAPNVESVSLNSYGKGFLDCEVAITILACEGVRGEPGMSSIRFAAAWEIRGSGTNATASIRGGFSAKSVTWGGSGYTQLAERLSEAIAEAARALAADLPVATNVPDRMIAPALP